jgi:prephenate dehydrogenase
MPPQARVCIIGLGLIGGSLALAMRRFAGVQHIVAVDADPQLTQRRVGDRIDHLYRPEQLAEACSALTSFFWRPQSPQPSIIYMISPACR